MDRLARPADTPVAPASMQLEPSLDTFPKLVADNARRMPNRVAIREKDLGIWQSYTWKEYADQSRLMALGLASLGFRRGDKAAIVGDNRPQLYWAMLATQALGGVPVPLYQDSIEREMLYIVDHAEARIAVVEDQEQVPVSPSFLVQRGTAGRTPTLWNIDLRLGYYLPIVRGPKWKVQMDLLHIGNPRDATAVDEYCTTRLRTKRRPTQTIGSRPPTSRRWRGGSACR